jgi:hypothetical protein
VQSGGNGYDVPKDGEAILEIAASPQLHMFTDAMLDNIFLKASLPAEPDDVIRLLAHSIVSRRPPRLIWEKRTFCERGEDGNQGQLFQKNCQIHLKKLADEHNIKLGQFLICDLKPIGFESRGPKMSKAEAKKAIDAGEQEEMIRVFPTPDAEEPVDIVEVDHSILHEIGAHAFRTYRLYVVLPPDGDNEELVHQLKAKVKDWN